ncbi:undecaprenyl/decaprenyl-phosphate alpha-N-acetylglucosaminyl 1-phosphate transferase [Streptomyces roseirectus]|uniref:Undecaprenyl/decaprenyl-phosphate alpha-N-acetylglucosaminyl 1-phosphate transferase n=1 Tax=Streptomyces roseirectus TaxID=2768066 RepID=A0A7H0IEP4_9ACTN|nr:MraY family glycosyltransferase [Streptomyces roseirectus]QNP71260.1 undecaprenyl/decaprenyl-phosphate alpha-N-acetylglucosaminyl 1-phosphate transferase [Streptomyces roseirectus]
MLYGISAATASLALAAVLAALLRVPALRVGLVERRQRLRKVPLSGGVAVAGATCAVAAVGDRTGLAPLDPGTGRLLVAAGAVALLGLAADLWRLKTRFLVLGTTVAAAFVIPFDGIGALGGVVSLTWVVFVALAFRGLDHADGVAGTVGVVTAFGVGACAAAEVMDGPAVLLSVLAAALTGFLMHNWPHARVGLGTCGALFAGFLPASVAVRACAEREPLPGAGVLFALTAVASLDVALVLLSRARAGRPLLRTAPDHVAHRLRRLGITAQGSVVLIGAASFAAALAGVLAHAGWVPASVTVWTVLVVAAAGAGLLRVRAYGPPGRSAAQVRPARGGETLGSRAPGPRRPRRAPGVRRLVALWRVRRTVPQASGVTPGVQVRGPRRPESSQVREGMRVRNG